jgi:hypothetical protein
MKTKIEVLRELVLSERKINEKEFVEKHNNNEFDIYLEAMEKFANIYEKEIDSFEEAARPLMKYLGHNHHPHTSAYIRNDFAELLEGQQTFGTNDYILD